MEAGDVTAVLVSQCVGLWRRTLLIEADGSRDTAPGVVWLQGDTAYVDSRGFAGTLTQRDSVFEWHRDVDVEPPGPLPDAGEMRWESDQLVETGVHADYVEHWRRDDGDVHPCGALFLVGPDGDPGLLMRVGSRFGLAGGGAVLLDDVGGPRWQALRIEAERVRDDAVVWTVRRREGTVI